MSPTARAIRAGSWRCRSSMRPIGRSPDDADAWAAAALEDHVHDENRAAVDARCRELVARLGEAGLTRYCVRREFGGALEDFDARAICLIRETLAYYDGLADFVFAMQGSGQRRDLARREPRAASRTTCR